MSFLVAKAALLLVLAVTSSVAQDDVKLTTEFCESLVKEFSACKTPATDNTIRLDQYEGVWYQIGTNAQNAFASFSQVGGQCNTANYSAPTKVLGMSTFGAENSFLKVIADPQRAQVAVISDSARAITLNILTVCRSLVGSALSVDNMLGAIHRLSGWTTNLDFKTQAELVRKQLASASERSRSVYQALAEIQLANNILNGGGLPLNTNVAGARATILAQTDEIKKLLVLFNEQRVNAHDSSEVLYNSAFNPLTKAAALSISQGLTGEIGDWFNSIQGISASVRAIEYSINALGTDKFENLTETFLNNTLEDPRTTAAEAARILGAMALEERISTQGRRLRTVGRKLQLQPLLQVESTTTTTDKGDIVTVDGVVRQTFAQAGRLQLAYSPLVFEDYLVLKTWGPADKGYSTALVYSCMRNSGTGNEPQDGLLLLSRTPAVAPAVISTALATAKTLGLEFDGDNPFVTIAQDPAFCGWQ